jgi:hypothetical protein
LQSKEDDEKVDCICYEPMAECEFVFTFKKDYQQEMNLTMGKCNDPFKYCSRVCTNNFNEGIKKVEERLNFKQQGMSNPKINSFRIRKNK